MKNKQKKSNVIYGVMYKSHGEWIGPHHRVISKDSFDKPTTQKRLNHFKNYVLKSKVRFSPMRVVSRV